MPCPYFSIVLNLVFPLEPSGEFFKNTNVPVKLLKILIHLIWVKSRKPYIFKSPSATTNDCWRYNSEQTESFLCSSHFMPLFKPCPGYMCSHVNTYPNTLTPPTKCDLPILWVWNQVPLPSWIILWWQLSTLISLSSNSIWCSQPPPISLSSFGCYFFCNTQLAPHYMLSSCSSVK